MIYFFVKIQMLYACMAYIQNLANGAHNVYTYEIILSSTQKLNQLWMNL